MHTLLLIVVSFTLVSISQYLLSKGAEARANARGSLLNRSMDSDLELVLSEEIYPESPEEDNEEESKELQEQYAENIPRFIDEQKDKSLQNLKEVVLDSHTTNFLNKISNMQTEIRDEKIEEHYIQDSFFELKTPKEDVTVSFPEVDLSFNQHPERGLFYIAGEIKEKFDDVLVAASDGTKERVFEHIKFRDFEEGDVFIGQVLVEDKRWHLLNVWVPNSYRDEEIEQVS